jgi:hypothetical protein
MDLRALARQYSFLEQGYNAKGTKPMQRTLLLLVLALFAAVLCSSAAGAAAGAPLAAHQDPLLGRLIAPTDRVRISYKFDTHGIKAPAGDLYVRTDTQRTFSRLRLAWKSGGLRAVVPARFLHSHRLFYYAIIRDARGSSTRVPARSATSAWILPKPVVVRLGTHRFGAATAPQAVVAHAGPGDVGFDRGVPGDVPGSGPTTFFVRKDGSIWLDDKVNARLLVYRHGPSRVVPLPKAFAEIPGYGDIAPGPNGSIYSTHGIADGDEHNRAVYRLTARGEVVWHTRLAGGLGFNTQLRNGPDGALYAVVHSVDFDLPGGDLGWMPVATADGRPLSVTAQRRGIIWGAQPVARGLRLISEVYTPPDWNPGPHETRYALITASGRIVGSWRVLSRTEINFGWMSPQLVGGDPVVELLLVGPRGLEHVVLRLGPHGTRARVSLPVDVFGDYLFTDVRVGPDGMLYRLSSSPDRGVFVTRYALS